MVEIWLCRPKMKFKIQLLKILDSKQRFYTSKSARQTSSIYPPSISVKKIFFLHQSIKCVRDQIYHFFYSSLPATFPNMLMYYCSLAHLDLNPWANFSYFCMQLPNISDNTSIVLQTSLSFTVPLSKILY